jgi:putative nucleotidyltransferase with HDIG domain
MQDTAFCEKRGRALTDHSVGAAYTARLIAERVEVNQDEAFLYGLLHDIGKLVILRIAHDHQTRTRVPIPGAVLEQALADRHAQLGAMVLRRWKLPESLDAPVLFHHDYAAAGDMVREAAVAYCANRLAHRYGFGCPPDPTDLLEDPALTFLGLDEEWLAATDARAPGLFAVAREILQ